MHFVIDTGIWLIFPFADEHFVDVTQIVHRVVLLHFHQCLGGLEGLLTVVTIQLLGVFYSERVLGWREVGFFYLF